MARICLRMAITRAGRPPRVGGRVREVESVRGSSWQVDVWARGLGPGKKAEVGLVFSSIYFDDCKINVSTKI